MKQLEVTILGQSYMLGCPDGGEAQLQRAVAAVDAEMSAIRDAGKTRARERIAVLAALNLAYRLHGAPAGTAVAPAVAPLAPVAPGATDSDVAALIARIDSVLMQGNAQLL